jgi:excisionase family DNA binding protein
MGETFRCLSQETAFFILSEVLMNIIFYKAIEIAQLLKISKALAYRLIAQGEIPSVKFGRTVRVRQEDLQAFVVNNLTCKDKHRGIVVQ